jgi:hypothetical protein
MTIDKTTTHPFFIGSLTCPWHRTDLSSLTPLEMLTWKVLPLPPSEGEGKGSRKVNPDLSLLSLGLIAFLDIFGWL